jgi:HK97 family phage portal protein
MSAAFFSGGVLTKTPFVVSPSYSTSWFPSMPPMSNGWPSAYDGIYKSHLWVYVLVNKLGGAEARLPFVTYSRGSDESRVRQPDHPMAKLLETPNRAMSGFDLWEWTANTENIFGQAFWYKIRRSGTVAELYPLHPASMTASDDGMSWTFDNGKRVIRDIPLRDLVHFKRYDAVSPLEPLRATLENEWHARTATSSFWQRGARPGMALMHPQTLSEPALDRLDAQMQRMHSGSANTGSTLFLEEGLTPHKLTLTAEEAQYIETRKLNREEVCAAYDVPPPVVHILDRATFSNITEQMRSMYRDTMAPRLKRHEAVVKRDLRLMEWPSDDIYSEFLMDEVLRGDFEARQDALAKADHMTIAEKRRVENLPFIDGTDTIFLNSATLPLDIILNPPEPAAPPVEEEPEEPEEEPEEDRPPLRLVRTVLGRLSWQKSLDEVHPVRVTKDVPDMLPVVLAALESERAAGGDVSGLRARLQGKESE